MPRLHSTNIDLAIGVALKQERVAHGFSRTKLASSLDVTHQQLSKYENGANRVTVSTLITICDILEIDICTFLTSIYKVKVNKNSTQRLGLEIARSLLSIDNKEFLYAFHDLITSVKDGSL